MNATNEAPDEMREADRIATQALNALSEHVDTVTIFMSKRREHGQDGTWRMVDGRGNWYARFGQVREWVIVQEAEMARSGEQDQSE